jgi:hypothetical protein
MSRACMKNDPDGPEYDTGFLSVYLFPDTSAVTMPAGNNQKRQSFSIYPRSLS